MTAPGIVRLERREPRGLDVPALKADLAGMWREAGDQGVVTRAAQATLVVAAGLEEGSDLLDRLLARYPARGILVAPRADLPPRDVEAWVSATCRREPGGEGLLCSEVIHIVAGPGAGDRIASGIRALAVGSLPLAVLVPGGDPADVDWVRTLAAEIEVVAVTSGARGWEGARPIWSHIVEGAVPRYSDLLWFRLESCRGALARWFDRPEEARRLPALRHVTLRGRGQETREPAALLFLGWLGSRLGWDTPTAVGWGWEAVGEGTPGRVLDVELRFHDDGPSLRFRTREVLDVIEVVDEAGRVRARTRSEGRRPVDWAEAALHDHGGDPVARDAYRFALALGESA